MQKSPLHAAGEVCPRPQRTRHSRRALLGAIAAAPLAVAAATPALAEGYDAELLALEAEIQQVHALVDNINAKRVSPFDDEYYDILGEPWQRSTASIQAALKFSEACGRTGAQKEIVDIFETTDDLFERLMRIPARTQAGRAAKVRALIVHNLGDEWRGTNEEIDDYAIEQARALLGEFAGLSAEELAAI